MGSTVPVITQGDFPALLGCSAVRAGIGYPLIGLCPLEWAFEMISEAMHGALLNRQRILFPQNCLPQVEELVESFPTRGPGPPRRDDVLRVLAGMPAPAVDT